MPTALNARHGHDFQSTPALRLAVILALDHLIVSHCIALQRNRRLAHPTPKAGTKYLSLCTELPQNLLVPLSALVARLKKVNHSLIRIPVTL